MYFSSLKLFEVLKFFQFLMLFENQFLDTSSNFGAPFSFTSFEYLPGLPDKSYNPFLHGAHLEY